MEETATPLPSPIPTGLSSAQTPSWCPLAEASAPEAQGRLRVVYTSSRDAWLWEEGGAAVRLTQTGTVEDISISDDGQYLAYTRRPGKGQAEVWVMALDDRAEHLLLNPGQLAGMRPETGLTAVIPAGLQWVPGTHLLSFNTYPLKKDPGMWIFTPDDLWLVDAENGELRSLLPNGEGGQAVFSPDGQWAAILRLQGLEVVEVGGRGRRKEALEGYFAVPEGESYFYPLPAWMPDSQGLLVVLPDTKNMYLPEATATLWWAPGRGGAPRPVQTIHGFAPSVVFSPDRTYLAFWPWPEAGTNLRHLRILEVESQDETGYVAAELLAFLGWSSDSRTFIYTQDASGEAWLGRLCQPPEPYPGMAAAPLSLQWVDETQILYLAPTPGPWELRLVTPAGSQTLAQLWGEGVKYDFALPGPTR